MVKKERESEIAEKEAQARLNVGIKLGDKCETCKVNDATQQILGDDNKAWHVCDVCLKEYWKIDMHDEESRKWRERKKRENAEVLAKKEIDSTIMAFKIHDRQKRQEWIERNYKILQLIISDEDIVKMFERE